MKISEITNTTELIGKTVVYESGKAYSQNLRKQLCKIEKVTKTGFRLEGKEDMLFDFNGHQKGLNSRMDMATISHCILVTEEEVITIKQEWKSKKEIAEMKTILKDKLETLTHSQLSEIMKVIQ